MKRTRTNQSSAAVFDPKCVGPYTMFAGGSAVSLTSREGVLEVAHGVLQSAIGAVDEALDAERAYVEALGKNGRGR